MSPNSGGCLCGAVRYETRADPLRVTFCHCRFCQRATGAAYLVEPIFGGDAFGTVTGTPSTYRQRSAGSGRLVTIHFCATCGTKLFMTFERFPEIVGVYGGTFDDSDWFPRGPETSKHIFLEAAQPGTIIPAGFPTFDQHATRPDRTAVEPQVFDHPHTMTRSRAR